MILVVSNILDDTAQGLVNMFPDGEALLFTSQSLSVAGLAVYNNQFDSSFITVNGSRLGVSSITGLIILIPAIFYWELIQIEEQDRHYVASEMTAFMTYLLTKLLCPKLNPPSASCLSGPNWRYEHWLKVAFHLNIPIQPLILTSEKTTLNHPNKETITTITIIGDQHCGTDKEILIEYAFQISKYTRLQLLQVNFRETDEGDHFFVSATQFPDLQNLQIKKAITHYFKSHC